MTLPLAGTKELRPFQVDGVKRMIRFLRSPVRGVYNGDEQGLGKTVQTIITVGTLQYSYNLIVCPAVMRHTWVQELKEWNLIENAEVFSPFTKKEWQARDKRLATYVVMSYDLATSVVDELAQYEWDCLILDEAHYVKNYKAKRTKALLGTLWPKAQHRICLSGTPITNNVVDAYSLFSKFMPTTWPKYVDFGARYAYVRDTPWAIKYEGLREDTLPELRSIIRKNFFFRRSKDEVLPELPRKNYQRVVLGPEYIVDPHGTDKEVTELDMEISAMIQRLETDKPLPPVSQTVAGLKRLQGEAKVPAVIEFVKDKLEQNIPVILFAYHTNVIAALERGLADYKPVTIQGGIGPKRVQNAVTDFQNGLTNLFIGQINAAGIGITLTRSSTVVLAELDWSPAVISQAVDRAHRIGQKDSVNIYYFVVPESIENDILDVLIRKATEHAKILENGEIHAHSIVS